MNLIIKNFSIMLVLSIVVSCSNDNFDTIDNTLSNQTDNKLIEKEAYLKNKFSVALANVFCKSEASRKFIKEEALKQFDYEYDVLYMLVKDKIIENNKTFEELLLNYIKKKSFPHYYKNFPL